MIGNKATRKATKHDALFAAKHAFPRGVYMYTVVDYHPLMVLRGARRTEIEQVAHRVWESAYFEYSNERYDPNRSLDLRWYYDGTPPNELAGFVVQIEEWASERIVIELRFGANIRTVTLGAKRLELLGGPFNELLLTLWAELRGSEELVWLDEQLLEANRPRGL